MSKMMGNLIDTRMKASWRMLEEWQSTIYSMMVFGATMVVMFWASVFLYTSFYFTYMPQESITWPIHLQYKSCGDQPGICSFPNSLVSVTDPSRGSLLARGQKYRVVLDLEMPESPTNQQSGTGLTQLSGMFLITMEMRSFTGDVLRKASRSSMLRYKSPLLQAMSTFIFAPFLLYGAHEEKQVVTAELFSQYEEDPVTPLSDVYIELGSRNIEVYSAQLRIHATFSGLRHFMYYYPLTAAVFGIGVCMVFLSLIVLFSWYQFSMPVEKMMLGPGGNPNGRLTVEDISKEDFEKDAKEGTDDSRRTSSASETSYSPAQMESDTKVEGSGWISLFSHRPSSPNNDTKESDKTSRRTSSHNISAFVARQSSVSNASCSSSRRSSIRNDDVTQDTSVQRKSSFFESIIGALSTPENLEDDIQQITLEVPPVKSRHSSISSSKDESTSKRSSWIFGDGVIDKKEELVIDDQSTNKEIGSRKSSWRSSWFGGDIDTLDTNEEPEKENLTSSKHSSRRSSFHNDETQDELLQQTENIDDKEDSLSSKHSSWRSSWFGGEHDTADMIEEPKKDETQEELLHQTAIADKEVSSINKRSSWRSSWFGGDSDANDYNKDPEKEQYIDSKPSSRKSSYRNEEPEKEKYTSSKPTSRKSSFRSDETQGELLQQTKNTDDKEFALPNKRSSWRSSWFGDELQDEPAEQLKESDSKVEGAKEDNGFIEDDSLKLPVPKSGASSRRASVGSLKSNTEQHELSSMPESSHTSTYLGDDLDTSTILDRSSPTDSRKSSTIGYSSGDRRPSFLESMIGMMINPNDLSSQQSHTEGETKVLEVPKNESRRSSRDSTRIDRKGSQNEDELNVHEYRRNSRRSSRGPTKEEVLYVPNVKSGSRRSSTGSFRDDSSEVNGRRLSRDVALEDAERLLQDANLVLRRKSSVKDSSIKRVSYLLDDDSHSPRRRRSSTSESVSQSLDTENNLYPSTVEVNTRRKSSTSFIKQLLTEPSDNDEVEVKKTSRSSSRDDSIYRRSSTTKSFLDPNEEESNTKNSSSTSDGNEVMQRKSQSTSPRPLSGRLSYLFQESETENLAPSPAVSTERRPSFMESMMGMLGGGGIATQNDSDNQEDEKE